MSFCRITGRSRGLPKPNYFPLLAPISPADAKRCCRITGKSYGLPSHHYIPVLLTSKSSKTKCKITNVAGELGPHHYSPEINYGNRKHEMLPDYRYIFPVLDGSTEAQKALIEMLLTKQVTEEKKYVYTVQERRCSLVFSAQMEAAVRDGDVRDVMLAKDSDTVLIKTKQGRSVSMDFKDFTEDIEMFEGEGPNAEVLKQREREEMEERKKKRKRAAGLSSMKKIFENKEKLAEVQELEEEKVRQDRMAKKAKLDEFKHEKHDLKTFSSTNFDVNHMRSKSSIIMSSGDWRDQLHPLIETWDWDVFEKEVTENNFTPKATALPTPVKIAPYHCETELYEVDRNISDVSVSLENVPCVNPLKPIKTRPSDEILKAVKDLSEERLNETTDIVEKLCEENKIGMLPTLENLTDVVKNINKGKRAKIAKVTGLKLDINKAKKFIPGQHINTPQGPVFVPGQTVETPVGSIFVPGLSVNTPAGPSLIPGYIVSNENTNEPFFLAGQVLNTANGEEFVCGQTIKTKEDTYRFVEGQTVISEEGLKFVPGKIINTGLDEIFVPGQSIMTPEGVQFIPGQTITESNGIIFTPGQNAKINNEWQFIPGQVVNQDDELHFVPGASIATPNGLKFVPGQTVSINGETCFVPGVTRTNSKNKLEFVPGTTVETIDGPKFIEGQIVQTEHGEKFLPGKTIVETNGHVEFSVAKKVEDITFSESAPMGLPIDIKTSSLSEESLYVFGHMVQTAKGIEFYPGPRVPKPEGKVVPGRLVKNEANESRFVPGMMVEGVFVPGQIVYTENGEQFVPGQVVDTVDGPKFVPGQVVNTKSGPKFVPGQTIHTIDGPRFVPGQIIETKAGPTFIPGQVISTDEGSRFVPGQVVDTEEGPRFVPGRVIETDDNGVTFIPGQIVQTPEGLKFVAPDLIEGEEGLEFSVQSFVVTPEELKLLKIKTNPNDTTSTKGELTIDTNMLKQLSEAGMSIGRQVPADLPAINVVLNETLNKEALKAFVTDFGLKDDVANQLMEVISSIIEMSAHLKSEIHENHSDGTKSEGSTVEMKKSKSGKKKMESQEGSGFNGGSGQTAQQEHIKNSIAAAVLAALVTAEQFEEVNNNNSREKYQLILKSIDTILGKAIDENFVAAMYEILQKAEDKDILCEEILDGTSQPKLELIKIAVNSVLHRHSITEEDMIDKFGDFLSSENEILGPAFKNIAKNDISLLHNVLGNISESISFIKTDNEATESLQKAIVSAVQESSAKELDLILQKTDNTDLKDLIVQSVGLAKILGMRDVAANLLLVMNDEESLAKIASDTTSLNILKRLTVMRKLADQDSSLQAALQKLETNPALARTDPKLRDLVRESAALMIVPEEPPLMSSADVPLSLLDPENSLAMEDFLFQRKRRASGALLIMKKGLQAVVPREASRAVLTGQVAYTVLDENGIRHFEPLHVFSALNLSQPTAHRFSMYSCLIEDNNDDDLQTFTGYCNVSNNQRITKFGGWPRKYSGVSLDRENTRSRISNLDHTPSYKRYSSRSSTRSRSSCSRSPPKVEDVVVASSDYTAAADDEVSLKAGDIVEVLDTKTALGSKPDPALDLEAVLLDSSAAKHKIAVRPKKKHSKKAISRAITGRWLVRVVEDVDGGELKTRQGWVPAGLLQKEKTAEQDATALAARRQAVVRELIETEEEFGRDMQQVVSRYMKPMDKATTPKPVFDSRELLFSNFKQIAEFHTTALLEGIKYYAGEPRMLGRALLRMEREFDKHVAYCRDEPRAQQLLAHEPTVRKYFQDLADKLGDDKGLAEHLKLPIQRINDYQLLFKELVKYSNRLGDDCTDLQKALELFLGVPNRATDNKFIASIEGFRGNIYKLGRLLTHDWFTVSDAEGNHKERYLFLFKARILVCKVRKVSDDRSVFALKSIVKLPEAEVIDHPEDPKSFSLRQKGTSHTVTLTAHREPVKTAWLAEIRKYASDAVALAEHAADDLQLLSPPQITSPEPEEKKKKREREEDDQETKEKRTKLETEVTKQTKEESQTAKRKSSGETEIASKISKSEEISSEVTSGKTEITAESVVASKVSKTKVKSSSEVTSAKTEVAVNETSRIVELSSSEVKTEKTEKAASLEVSKEVSKTLELEVSSSEFESTNLNVEVLNTLSKSEEKASSDVKSATLTSDSKTEQKTLLETETVVLKRDSKEDIQTVSDTNAETKTESETAHSFSDSKREVKSSLETKSLDSSDKRIEKLKSKSETISVSESDSKTEFTTVSETKVSAVSYLKEEVTNDSEIKSSAIANDLKTEISSVIETKSSGTTGATKSKSTAETVKSELGLHEEEEKVIVQTQQSSDTKLAVKASEVVQSQNKLISQGAEEHTTVEQQKQKSEKVQQESLSSKLRIETDKTAEDNQVLTREESLAQLIASRQTFQSAKTEKSEDLNAVDSAGAVHDKVESKGQSVIAEGRQTYQSTKTEKSKNLETGDSEGGINDKVENNGQAVIEEGRQIYQSTKTEKSKDLETGNSGGGTNAKVESNGQAVIEEGREIYQSNKTGKSEDLDTGDSEGGINDKVENNGQAVIGEGRQIYQSIKTEKSKDLDTGDSAGDINDKVENNGQAVIEEGRQIYQSTKTEKSKDLNTGDSAGDINDKVDNNGQAVIEEGDEMSRYSRSSRLSGDYSSSRRYEASAEYESSGISSSYRRESSSRIQSGRYETGGSIDSTYESKYSSSIEGGSKYGIESSYNETSSKIDSIASKYGIEGYGSTKIEDVTSEYSKTAIANGSISGEFETSRSIAKSGASDGKPVFKKTLQGQNIEPGENAVFECQLQESTETIKVTWLKDNKPLTDKLMDRVNISSKGEGQNKLEILHCHEDDTGLYTARAENTKGNTHCTAQLVVHELTPEERKAKNALNAPYFLVALKDTEILLNTYLRFMVKVKGDPNPEVTFYRDGKEIKTTTENDRISIIRTLSERGCYELVIADVCHEDAGKYSCRAMNIYGEVETEAVVTVVDDKNIFFELPPGGEGLLAKGEKPVFAWKRDGEPFDPEERFKVLMGEDEDTLALVFQHVKPEDAGLYTCVAKTSTGNISCSAELTVQGAVHELHREPEKPTLIIEHKEPIVVSAGASAMLELVCKGFPKPSIVFKHDGKIIEADTRHKFLYEDDESMSLVIKNATSSDAGEYHVTATNELGEDTTTIKLIIKAAPKIKKKIENQTCMVGSTHTVTVEVEGTPAPEVQFYKDGVEIKSSDRVQIVKESDEVYKIIIKDTKLTDTGSYSVVAKNEVNQCSDFWQWHVTSPPKFTKKLGGDIVVDQNEKVTLQVEAEADPAPTVTWFKNKAELVDSSSVKICSSGSAHSLVITSAARADAGEYSCEIRNVHGTASDSCKVNVKGAPIFTQKLKDITACEGDVNVEFTVSVEAFPEPTVKWYLGDVEITEKKTVFTRVDSGSSHKLILKEVTAEYSGKYSCKVSNNLGSEECHANFTVKRKPRITKSLVDMTVDAGATLKLEVEVEGTPDPTIKWFKDGKEVNLDARIKIERDTQRLENYYLTVNMVKEEDGGEYEVTAKNEMGSVSSKSTVTVHTTEVHSRLNKEKAEDIEIEDDNLNKAVEENVGLGQKLKAEKGKTKAEEVEEKSFWDDIEDSDAKKAHIDEIDQPVSEKARKSLTEPEIAEEKSIWDENHNESKQPIIEEVDDEPQVPKKGVTQPETIVEEEISEDLKSPKRKSVIEIVEEPLSAETEGRVFETVTTFKKADDGSIIVSKVSSTKSHGAIITGPAETRTLHKMTSTAVYYDDDGEYTGRKIIKPIQPHKTSLEVEEIASHCYFLSESGHYTIPDHIRRGTYGLIEEPATDSETDNNSRCGRNYTNRTVSIMSLSEEESSWHNGPLSREISIEDLSKSIFDIDDTKKVFSKDSYVTQSSFKEDYYTDEGEEELILKEKSEKVFENDITDKLIHISKEFDEYDFKAAKTKLDDIKNRIIEEFVVSPTKNFDKVTKDVTESTVERKKKHVSRLCSVEEEVDDEIEALLRRSQRQRSILDDILNEENEKAPPTIKDSSMKDGSVYESLPLVYTVSAAGAPKPIVKWLHNGKEVKPSSRVHITNDGDVYKLVIDSVEMGDDGKWQCEVSNDLGKKVQSAELSVTSVSEFRKPIFTSPLEAQQVMQREPVTMKAVCTADPQPHVSWLLNGVELTPDATIVTSAESKDIEHGLKECTFTLHLPTGRHADTGIYTIKAKNQYGVGESSARLDILLRPEIEGLKDITAVPFEETTFIANIKANPIAEVKWSKDGYAIQPSSQYDIIEDKALEQYKLVVKKCGVGDAGVYTVTAKNKFGEASQQAKLSIHTDEPKFTKPLQKETVKDYDDVTLKVRCDGVPKPQVLWYRDGVEITNDERHTITTEVGGQVDSELAIKHFNASDAGKYKVRAVSLSGEAVCEAPISLAATSPGFAHKLDRQRDIDEGEPLELKCKVDGSPIPTAKWYKDGVELSPNDNHIKQTVLPDGTIKLNIEQVTPSDCGAYKLVISNPHGENSALCAVAINPTPRKPSFSQELEDVKAVVGQPLKLEARVMAFPAPEVKWFKDGLPIRPSQAISFINQPGGIIGLSIDSVKPEDAGTYQVTVTNKLGDVASKAKVEVGLKEKKPAFIAELQPAKVIEGFPVKLEVKVLGHPPPIIKWTHNGKEIVPDGQHIKVISQPDGTHALLIDKAAAADAGKYGVIALNDKGEMGCSADLDVASRADDSSPQERPQFIHGLRDVTAEEGQPLSITAPFVGNPIPDVEWTKDGKPLKPSEKILLTCDGKRVGIEINPVELPDAGVYSVKLVNPLGEDSSQGKLNVRKVYQPPSFSQKFSDLQQLPTFDANFPARVNGVPAPDITWFKDGQQIHESDKYHIKRDGDACCLYIREITDKDAGRYKCLATNREGEAICEANLEVVDKIGKRQKMEPPSFLKKIGDIEVLRGMSAKFTACATGEPEPEVEWFRNDEKLFPCERIRMDKETTGLLRLTISGIDPADVGTYTCRISNPYGEDKCSAQLTYDTLEPTPQKRPISEQYSDFDKMKKTGIPMPLADPPIISRMTDRHLTLSWKPSIPHGPRFPVTYQVEMCELPDGDWFTARTGLRSCVCDIRNLEPFRDYKFRIRVENKYGVSDPSPFAVTHRAKLQPDPPKFVPYLEPGIDFRPETSPYFPKDFDIERPPHDGYAQAPKFLRQEYDSQYGVKGHNVNLFWFVYGYPKPKMAYYFNDEPIEIGGRYDWSYTRNGQATLFINKMLERDVGWYEAVATNEHGQARQRVRLELAEYPTFIKRPEETIVLQRKSARIEARVTGVPFPDIKWYKDWQPITASTRVKIQFVEPDTTILIINDTILKDEGLYSVSARNVAGSVSSSAMLHVEEEEHIYTDRIRAHPPRVKPSTKPFGDFYDLGDELGRGVQGVVYHAAERLTGRNYAAKIMHGHSALKPFMKNELDIMNMLNDRHLVRLHDAYEHEHTLALVMELAAGGELVRDRLLRSQGYSEREIAGYIRQLLRGLKYMHDNSIAHLGLTIGELLLSHAGSDELKICDFGLSRRIQFGKHAALDYGMPEFVAPEVASGDGVSFAADMWSVGIITYILLSGHSPFRGANDRETLTKIREGRWEWHDEEWWSRLSTESRDFISKLLTYNWHERLDVSSALSHPWLTLADKIYQDEYLITTDRLRNYYNLYRDWTGNAQCRTWFRRRPLSGAFEHPSKMVYPPGEIYTPEGTPDRDSHERKPAAWDLKFKQWDHPDWEVSAKSESHYQNGPDTYLLQLRDTQFPVRLREYMKVACHRSPAYNLAVNDSYDPRTPIIRERRRFTDIMDEEIDDERRERINNYGTESYTIRRLRHELGTRLDSYAEAQAFMESKKDGQLPFIREKPQILPIREGEPAQLSCYAVGDPKPVIQWFKNDMVIAEGQRIKIIEDEEGRSTLKFEPAMHHDIGFYKVVARNKVGQTVARTRVVEATNPDAPDSPTATEVSDTEVLLRWKQPKYDGNSPVVCYSLQYKEGDSVEWKEVANNIDHEFFVVRDLKPDTSYQFRLSSRNRIGWSDKGIPTHLVKTKEAGAPKIEVTKAMRHLQQMTESGQEIVLDEERPKLNYNIENSPIDWDSSDAFTERYSFISELWRGKFSIVVKGVDKQTDQVVVSKILESRPETEVQIQREFECIRRLRHERISNMLAAYQAPGHSVAALILEKLQGADILTYLSSRHDYTEQMVATIVTQILDGLQYLHWRGYCHLDLQPDNVVMASVRSIQVKLIDFGSAHKVTKLGTSVPQVGELEYKAPEIINDEPAYPQTDIWSVGVLTYIMLSGVSPFRGADDQETKQNISFVRYRFEHLYKEITQEATRFLMFLFKKVPLKRPSAEECHEHRWLAQSDFMNKKRERAVFLGNRLKEFSEEYHERKAREASQADTVTAAFGKLSPRHLTRSNSVQDELQTTFSSR